MKFFNKFLNKLQLPILKKFDMTELVLVVLMVVYIIVPLPLPLALAEFIDTTVGSLVIDEDLSIFGKSGEYFRQLYVDDKNGKNTKKISFRIKSTKESESSNESESTKEPTSETKIKFKVKAKISDSEKVDNSFNNYDDSKLETIPFSEFKDIKVLEDGVCGLKVC